MSRLILLCACDCNISDKSWSILNSISEIHSRCDVNEQDEHGLNVMDYLMREMDCQTIDETLAMIDTKCPKFCHYWDLDEESDA